MVMSFDLDAGKSFGHGLDELAKAHFDHECMTYKSLCGTGAKQITFDKVPLGPATEYAGEDADITLRLWLRLQPRLAEENVARVYERVDKPLVPVISRMERRGIKVDRDYLARLSAEFGRDIQSLEEKYLRGGVRAVHDRIAAAARRSALRPARPQGRAQGQERAIFDRRQRARAARRGRRDLRDAGARMAAADQAQEHLHRRAAGSRSIRRRGGSTPASA